MLYQTSTLKTTPSRSCVSTHYSAASTSTLKPRSVTEGYEGQFEKILDDQDKRMHSVINTLGVLDGKNNAALKAYKSLTKDNINETDDINSLLQDAENLIKKLKITLISDYDNIPSLKQAIRENVFIPTTNVNQIWIDSNRKLNIHRMKSNIYLEGRILAVKPVLELKIPRLEPEKFIEELNKAAIEKFFYCLELLITETDVTKALSQEEKKEQLYNMILLAFAQKFYSLKFLNWYKHTNGKNEQLMRKKGSKEDISDLKEEIIMLKDYILFIEHELNKQNEELGNNYDYVQLLETEKYFLEEQVKDLINKVETLNRALEQEKKDRLKTEKLLKDEIKNKSDRIFSLEEEKNKLEQNIKDEIENRESCTKEKEELEKEISAVQKLILTLKSELNIKNQELSEKQTIERLLEEENSKFKEQMNELTNEVKTLKQALVQQEINSGHIKKRIKLLNNDYSKITQENKSLKSENQELKDKEEKNQRELEKRQSELEEIRNQLNNMEIDCNENKELKNKIKLLRDNNENIISEYKKIKDSYHEIQIEIKKNKKYIEEQESNLKAYKKELEENKINLENTLFELDNYKDKYNQKEGEINFLNIRLLTLSNVIAEKESILQELKLKSSKNEESFKDDIKNKEYEINILKEEKNKLKESLEFSRKTIDQYILIIEELNDNIQLLSYDYENILGKYNNLKLENNELKNLIEKIKSQLNEREIKTNSLKHEIAELEKKIIYQQEEITYLHTKTQLQDQQITKQIIEINDQNIRIESLEREKSNFQEKNEFLIQEVTAQKKKISKDEKISIDIKIKIESLNDCLDNFIDINKSFQENTNECLKKQYEQNQSQFDYFKKKLKEIKSDYQKKDRDLEQIKKSLEFLILHVITSPAIKVTEKKHLIFNDINLPSNAIKDLNLFRKAAENPCDEQDCFSLLEKLFLKINNSDLLKKYPQASNKLIESSIYMVYSLVKNGKLSHSYGVNLLLSIRPAMGTFIDRVPLEIYLSTLAYLVESCPNDKDNLKNRIINKFNKGENDITLYKIIKQSIKDNYIDKKIDLPENIKQSLIQFNEQSLIPTERELYKIIKRKINVSTEKNDKKFNILEDHIDTSIEEIIEIEKKDSEKQSIVTVTSCPLMRKLSGNGKVKLIGPVFFRKTSKNEQESTDLEEKIQTQFTQ